MNAAKGRQSSTPFEKDALMVSRSLWYLENAIEWRGEALDVTTTNF